MAEEPSCWEEDTEYPVRDWKYEVQNDDTRLGYLEWVDHQKESNDGRDDHTG